jgi:hypothetical protein
MTMRLKAVIPWGRSFDEYRRMFALTDADLAGSLLGCGDGPASFNAEATARRHLVVSCDPIYAFSAPEIERRVNECYVTVLEQVKQAPDGFVWDYFRDPDHLGACRLAAMRRFLADFDTGKREQRYVAASLPTLPFPDGRFTLALASHLLFLYSEQLDLDFHIAAIEELLRVAREVRVFPLVDLGRHWSRHVEPVRDHLERAGFAAEVVAVDYGFQRAEAHAGNLMLRLTAPPPAGYGAATRWAGATPRKGAAWPRHSGSAWYTACAASGSGATGSSSPAATGPTAS